jgi:hypothetical protein
VQATGTVNVDAEFAADRIADVTVRIEALGLVRTRRD